MEIGVDAADDASCWTSMPASLPIIWDADFLYGPRDRAGEDTYVLCEINVSSCFAFPDQAPGAIARLARPGCNGSHLPALLR